MPREIFVDVLPIPDRIDNGKCRIAIQLTPTISPRLSSSINVEHWPAEIADRIRRVRLHVASYDYEKRSIIDRRTPIELPTDMAEIYDDQGIVSRATEKWRETFPISTDWDAILGALNEDEAQSVKQALLVQGHDAVGGHAGAMLDELITEFYKIAQANEVKHERFFTLI